LANQDKVTPFVMAHIDFTKVLLVADACCDAKKFDLACNVLILVDALVYRAKELPKIEWLTKLSFCFHRQTNSVVFSLLVNLLYASPDRGQLSEDLLKSDYVIKNVWDYLSQQPD
jgi:hypothetical protein